MHKSRAPDMKTALEAVMTSLRLAYGAGSLVLLSMLSGQASSQAAPPPPPAVTVAKPIVKEITEKDDFIGRFEAVDQVEIRARVSGYLDKVHFRTARSSRRATCSSRSTNGPIRQPRRGGSECRLRSGAGRVRLERSRARRVAAALRQHLRSGSRPAPIHLS